MLKKKHVLIITVVISITVLVIIGGYLLWQKQYNKPQIEQTSLNTQENVEKENNNNNITKETINKISIDESNRINDAELPIPEKTPELKEIAEVHKKKTLEKIEYDKEVEKKYPTKKYIGSETVIPDQTNIDYYGIEYIYSPSRKRIITYSNLNGYYYGKGLKNKVDFNLRSVISAKHFWLNDDTFIISIDRAKTAQSSFGEYPTLTTTTDSSKTGVFKLNLLDKSITQITGLGSEGINTQGYVIPAKNGELKLIISEGKKVYIYSNDLSSKETLFETTYLHQVVTPTVGSEGQFSVYNGKEKTLVLETKEF